jgi:hypothetical protein
VVINGNNINEATGVFFGATAAGSWQAISDTQIEAVSPSTSGGLQYADVTITSPGGTSQLSALDQYCWYDPTLGQTVAKCVNGPQDPGA